MARRRRMTTVFTPFKHPLVLAVLLYLPLATSGLGLDLRLWLLEPVAWASSEAEAPNYEALSDEERKDLQIAGLQDEVAVLAYQLEMTRQGFHQLQDLNIDYPELSEKALLANITVRGDASNWRHCFYIDAGVRDGVVDGNPVTMGRTLIGKVLAAGPNQSVVQMITDPGCVVPVSIIPASDSLDLYSRKAADGANEGSAESFLASQSVDPLQLTRGLLRGNTSAQPRMPTLPVSGVNLESRIAPGMLVVTNDSQGHFPPGLLVGRISEIHDRNDFLDIEVQSAMDLDLVDVVTVIRHRRPTMDENLRLRIPERHLDPLSEEEDS